MSARGVRTYVAIAFALANAWPRAVAAQTRSSEAEARGSDSDATRESEMFGSEREPAEAREGDMAGSSRSEEREAQMFGDDAAPALAGEEALGRGAAAPVEASPLESKFAAALEARDAATQIGGQIYLRLDTTSSPLRYRVDGEGEVAGEEPLSSPNLADVFLDARPSDRLRAFVRGRLRYDFTVRSDSRVFGQPLDRSQVGLDQLWLKFDIYEVAYLTAGQQPIRWGSSRFWNPTDFLNQQTRDPLAVLDERAGINLVKAHLPVELYGWNFYAVANLEGASQPEEIGAALRAELLFGETEIALSGAYRKDTPRRYGLDISAGWWLFDLRAELALTHGLETPFWSGPYRVDPGNLVFEVPRQRSRKDDPILQAVAGAELSFNYTDDDAAIIGAEYFYNDLGYKTNKLYPWLVAIGQFDPLYVGRHYVAAYLLLAAPLRFDDTTIIGSGLGNLSDLSFLARLDYRVRVLTLLDFYLYGTYHFGEEGVFRFGLEGIEIPGRGEEAVDRFLEEQGLDPAAAVALERGQPTARWEAGLGLRLTL